MAGHAGDEVMSATPDQRRIRGLYQKAYERRILTGGQRYTRGEVDSRLDLIVAYMEGYGLVLTSQAAHRLHDRLAGLRTGETGLVDDLIHWACEGPSVGDMDVYRLDDKLRDVLDGQYNRYDVWPKLPYRSCPQWVEIRHRC